MTDLHSSERMRHEHEPGKLKTDAIREDRRGRELAELCSNIRPKRSW